MRGEREHRDKVKERERERKGDIKSKREIIRE